MTSRDFAALVHEGRVLVDASGAVPSIHKDDDDDASFAEVLGLVRADLMIAPCIRLAQDLYVTVATVRDTPPRSGLWVDVGSLTDPVDAPGLADAVRRSLTEYEGSPPPRRPEWYRKGWFDGVEAWVDTALAAAGRSRTGPLVVHRMWAISAVLRIPTDAGEHWFKATCDHFRDESAVHRVLAKHHPDFVPVLVAEDDDRAWLLMEQLHGSSEQEQADGATLALASAYPSVQLASMDIQDELRAAGCPDRGLAATIRGWRDLLAGGIELSQLTAAELSAVRGAGVEVEAVLEEFWSCGLPDTLCHGDLHVGNVAYDGSQLRVFDWTDASMSHPLLDVSHLLDFGPALGFDSKVVHEGVADTFRDFWRAAYPDADVDRAMALAPFVDRVFQAVSYDGIYRGTEDASLWELGGMSARLLRGIPGSLAELR